jgi:hypothetical protein
VFVKRVLSRIFPPEDKTREIRGKLHKEALHNWSFRPHTITVIKSIRMTWAGHVARMGRRIFLWKNMNETNHYDKLGVDRKNNIKMDLKGI